MPLPTTQVRSLPIRKDDEVQIVKGKHAKEVLSLKITTLDSKCTSPLTFRDFLTSSRGRL